MLDALSKNNFRLEKKLNSLIGFFFQDVCFYNFVMFILTDYPNTQDSAT